jgi:serine/threonine-protein kinase
MEKLEAAARNIAQREALLFEARQELDRALKVGGPGRFTDQVVGHYRLGSVLGRGAMGEVYEAAHVDSGAPAAVKLLSASAAGDAQIVERFLREVRIAAALDVPNVVRVLETPASADVLPFLAMERLAGQTLADLLRDRGRMPLPEATAMIADLLRGLEAAHAAGVVHRDMKPQNVFAHREAGDVVWKILDFGVSRLAGEGTLTRDQLVGTPTYMPPEQAEGKPVDHRADLYSLGVVAYRAITGRPAYSGQDAAAILFRVAGSLPPAPTVVVPSLPPAVDRVLAVAMAKSPASRFQSAAEMREAFVALGRGELAPGVDAKAEAALADCPWGGSVRRREPDAGPG